MLLPSLFPVVIRVASYISIVVIFTSVITFTVIKRPKNEVFVRFGEFIILEEDVIVNINCSLLIDQAIDEIPNPSITWFRDNIKVVSNSVPNVAISNDGRFCRIKTKMSSGAELGNKGCYVCEVCDYPMNQKCSRSSDTCIAVCGE